MVVSCYEMVKAYNEIVQGCYSPKVSEAKIKCSRYFNKFLEVKRISIDRFDENMFCEYFTKWLPYEICMEDIDVITSFYTATEEYVRLADMLGGTEVVEVFHGMNSETRYTSSRLMLLKRKVMEFNHSYLISKMPLIIDFDNYKNKIKDSSEKVIFDSGQFRVESVFSRNSVVLNKIGMNGYYIRLFFDAEIIKLIEERDILDIKIKRDTLNRKWILYEITGCYTG